ncbi:hypothetical protein ACNOYE_39050 [Nannocystaceae bacterium ST9]
MPRTSATPTAIVLALASIALLGPGSAQAGNTVHPRTPVLWPDAPCIASVDRTIDPLLTFGYEIPAEDTLLTVDELDDSRTHQFVGFCRQWPAGTSPPQYVSVDDLERAVESGSELDATKLDDPESTLETSVEWAGCWTRITADDQRRPITFEAAAEPVVWDTSELAAGTWVVAGYTWEPPYNLWRRAPWVVRVFDGEVDPAALQPAVAVGSTPELLSEDEPLELDLCVAADPEATVRVAWATTEDELPNWHEGEPMPLAGASMLALPFTTPPEAWGLTLLLRARVEGASGSDYASYPLAPIIVIKPGGIEDTGEGDSTSEGSSESESGSGDESGEGPGLGEGSEGSSDGCHCTSEPTRRGSPLAWALASLGLLALRRRAVIR